MSGIEFKSRRAFVLSGLPALLMPAATGRTAAAQDADWTVATPDSQGMAGTTLDEILTAALSIENLRSVVVVRNGTLIAERYYHGTAATDLLPVNSITKSVSSLLLGLALAQGRIDGLSQTVAALLPEDAAKAPGSAAGTVTLEQILTGTTGLDFDFVAQLGALFRAPDPVQFALALPRDGRAQPDWRYNDAAVGLIAPILRRATGLSLDAFAKETLFAALGIERAEWVPDRPGNARSYAGLRLRTRDVAKIAWTMADGGKWRGAQALPAAWVEQSLRPRVPVDWEVWPVEQLKYGYLWFTGMMKGRPIAWGWGYGAQFALLVPSLRLAVATACRNPERKDVSRLNDAVMAVIVRIVDLAVAH